MVDLQTIIALMKVHMPKCTNKSEGKLFKKDIIAQDFIDQINKIIYHLDYPCAGLVLSSVYDFSRSE